MPARFSFRIRASAVETYFLQSMHFAIDRCLSPFPARIWAPANTCISLWPQTRYDPSDMDLPYLTTDFPGIGGVIKRRAEDFFVQEIPLYEPSGQGEHTYCEI